MERTIQEVFEWLLDDGSYSGDVLFDLDWASILPKGITKKEHAKCRKAILSTINRLAPDSGTLEEALKRVKATCTVPELLRNWANRRELVRTPTNSKADKAMLIAYPYVKEFKLSLEEAVIAAYIDDKLTDDLKDRALATIRTYKLSLAGILGFEPDYALSTTVDALLMEAGLWKPKRGELYLAEYWQYRWYPSRERYGYLSTEYED